MYFLYKMYKKNEVKLSIQLLRGNSNTVGSFGHCSFKTVLYPQLTWQQNLAGKDYIEDGIEYNSGDHISYYISSVMKTKGPQTMNRGNETIHKARLVKKGDESNNYDARLMK